MTRHAAAARQADRHRADRFVFAPDDRASTVLHVIRSARKRLILSLFRCDDFEILDALAAALRRGVEVAVLVTPRAKGWTKRLNELWSVLEGMGAALCRYADPVVKYHAKYLVADDGPALVASLNFTRKCFTSTCDFVVTTYDPAVVGGLRRLFEADSRGPAASLPPRLASRLIVGPEHARRDLTRLIEGARHRIRIIDPKLTDPAILDLLKAKRAAGVTVTVLGQDALGGYVPHGKMMLVDDAVGVVGSLSLSALSLDFRREVALVVRDQACVSRMHRVFQRLAGPGASRRAPRVN
jgi:phosphatidylserine/phosphatidylglycerophosphate/cardiolipin synthase-like enzyme